MSDSASDDERNSSRQFLFNRLLEEGPDLVGILNADLCFTYLNSRGRLWLNIGPDTPYPITLEQAGLAEQRHALGDILGGEHEVRLEWTSRQQAYERNLELHIMPEPVAGQAIVLGHDITHHKQTEADLNFSQEFISAIALAMPDALYVYDLITESNVYVNREITHLLGYTDDVVDELSVTLLEDFIHPDDFARQQEVASRWAMVSDDEVIQSRYRFRRADGAWCWMQIREVVFSRDEQGKPTQILGVAEDITEREEQNARIAHSERLYRAFAENFPDGMLALFDHDLHYVLADGHLMRQRGLTPADFEGRTLYDIYPPDVCDQIAPFMRAALRGESGVTELWYNNTLFLCRFAPVRGEGDSILYGLMNATDITGRKEAEQQVLEHERLQIALSNQQELNQLKSDLMVRISHEFRTPMSIVLTSNEILERYYNRLAEEKRTHHYRQIRTAISRLTLILDELSSMVLLDQEGPPINRQIVNMVELCRIILTHYENQEGNQHHYNLAVNGTAYALMGDPDDLQLAVRHLVSNAVQYTPPGTAITIQLQFDPEGCMVSVKDNGQGIAEADLPHVLEPFYRGQNATSIAGIGLGLSLVRAVARGHGGHVSIESGPGQGTAVHLYLPNYVPNATPA